MAAYPNSGKTGAWHVNDGSKQDASRALGRVYDRGHRPGDPRRSGDPNSAVGHFGGSDIPRLALSHKWHYRPYHHLLDKTGTGLLVVAVFGRARYRGRNRLDRLAGQRRDFAHSVADRLLCDRGYSLDHVRA